MSILRKLKNKIVDDLIPNELKSPAGAVAAALAVDQFGIPLPGGSKIGGKKVVTGPISRGIQSIFSGGSSTPVNTEIEELKRAGKIPTTESEKDKSLLSRIGSGITSVGSFLLKNPELASIGAGLVAGAFSRKEDDPLYTGQSVGLNLRDIRKLANISDPRTGAAIGLNFLPETRFRQFTPEQMAETYAATEPVEFTEQRESADTGGRIGFDDGGENLASDPNYKGWVKVYEKNPDLAEMNDNHSRYLRFYNSQSKSGGGLMNLGGNEMDLRGGGFVPIGVREKADDVPARLSKNEFVFTADAVRAAGGGSVDKGADLMYKTMKQLENKVA